jgi:hypothetical protein
MEFSVDRCLGILEIGCGGSTWNTTELKSANWRAAASPLRINEPIGMSDLNVDSALCASSGIDRSLGLDMFGAGGCLTFHVKHIA